MSSLRPEIQAALNHLEGQFLHLDSAFSSFWLHGMLVGCLCLSPQKPVLGPAMLEAELPSALKDQSEECGLLNALFEVVRETLCVAESIELMIPADSAPLPERLQGIRDWCEGFVRGIELYNKEKSFTLPDDLKEVLEDLSQIVELDVDANESEENERHFMEIVEYVRVGVLLFLGECDSPIVKDTNVVH